MIRACRRVEMGLWLGLLLAAIGCGSASDAERDLFCYNASDGIRSLDPAKATDLETMWVVDQLYEGLLELDADLRVIPALAEAWSVSDDGLDYRFRLRHATFHNGDTLTAYDVVASLERLRDPSEALPGRWVLSDVAGSGLQVLGPDSLVVSLTRPNPVFPSLLATPQASVLRGGGRTGNPDVEDLGTGPFRLQGWLPETAMVLHAHPDYWMKNEAGDRLPRLEGLRIEFNREEGAEMLGFQQGRYDFVSAPAAEWMGLFFDAPGQWQARWEGRFEAHSTAYLKTDYIGLFVDSAGLSAMGLEPVHPEVRAALSLAIDRAALVSELKAGGAQPAVGFVPPGMPGFQNEERPPLDVVRHDPDEARRLLARHGIGPEPPLKRWTGWTLGTKPATADLAAYLQHVWSEFGVDIDIDVAPSAIDAERVAKGQVPAFRKSWLADYPDAENFLGLFDRSRWAPNGPNYTHYADPEADRMLAEVAELPQGRERESRLRDLEAQVMATVPVIPLWHDEVLHLVSSEWAGWQVSAINRLDLRHVHRRDARP